MTVDGDQGHRPTETAQTRGFLFADIRGYTEYLERHGAAAAAELLARYRAIVRATVAEHHGAEIRTEGDSFYVVLPSASAAVRCAMAIVESVDAENAREPENAIRVGIGVHAGEAIETDEGLVGSAVNIAARLSAIARPGEVLLSATVRALTRSVIPVRYLPRGRHRLKGVAEPQEIFAAVPASAPVAVANRRFGRPLATALGVVGLAVILVVIYISLPAGAAPLASPTPSSIAAGPTPTIALTTTASLPAASGTLPVTSISASPALTGPAIVSIDPNVTFIFGGPPPLKPGLWRYDSFRPILVFNIDAALDDRQWYPIIAASDYSSIYGLPALTDSSWNYRLGVKSGMVLLSFVRLQTVIGNPCDPGDTASYQVLGGRPRDVVDWLAHNRFLTATNRQPAALAGWIGLSVDVTVSGDPGKACSGSTIPHQGSAYLFKTTPSSNGYNGIYLLKDGEAAHFIVLDIGADTPLVLIAACRVADCAKVQPWALDVINTITVSNG